MSTVAPSPPEQGQLVSVRSRHWMVTEVSPSTLPPDRLQAGLDGPQNLLTLSSVEDDGLGEELQVIWEIEPGTKVIEKVALPEPAGFDPPDMLDAFLDAVRWGAASIADVKNIQVPFLLVAGKVVLWCLQPLFRAGTVLWFEGSPALPSETCKRIAQQRSF
jgi:hypothetical protein